MQELQTDDRFTALINAAVDGIFIINPNGIIEVANQSVGKMLGYNPSELIGHNISTLMPLPHRVEHDDYLRHYLDTGEAKIIGIGREVEAQKKDGSLLPIHLSVGRYDSKDATKFVGIIRDLTREKQRQSELEHAEQEIHQLVNRLAHASRVGVMGEMAASIAHEINQPLTAIASYAQACTRLLTAEKSQTNDVISALDKIGDQAIRAGDIIRSMRTWVSEQDVQRRPCSCDQLVLEVVELATMESQNHGIELQLSLETRSTNIVCDPIQIQQVMLNLVKNAIDAVASFQPTEQDTGKKILIATKCLQQDRVQVTVTDFGPGIEDEIARNVFDPFFTTKKAGMGLGLSICRTIIRAHGGELNYKSNPQGGVSFYFILPTAVESE